VANLSDFERRFEFETNGRLGGKYDVFVARERGTRASGARACQRADCRAFTATGQAANERAQSGSTSGNHRRSVAFTFL